MKIFLSNISLFLFIKKLPSTIWDITFEESILLLQKTHQPWYYWLCYINKSRYEIISSVSKFLLWANSQEVLVPLISQSIYKKQIIHFRFKVKWIIPIQMEKNKNVFFIELGNLMDLKLIIQNSQLYFMEQNHFML